MSVPKSTRETLAEIMRRKVCGAIDPPGSQTLQLRRLPGAEAPDADASGIIIAQGATGGGHHDRGLPAAVDRQGRRPALDRTTVPERP